MRTRPLTRQGRFRLATAALVPLSLVVLFSAADLLSGVVPLRHTGSAWLGNSLGALGVRTQATIGNTTFDVHVLALLAAPLVLCVGYVFVQFTSGVVFRLRDSDASSGPIPAVDRVATGWFSVPASGSMAVWLWSILGGSSKRPGRGVSLPDSKADWKYDDPEAERAHRRAQQRDPAEAVEIGEVVPLVLEDVDYGSRPPTVMGSRNALKVFVEDVPDDLSQRETICVKVTDYGGKRTSADAVFLSRGGCTDVDRRT